MKMNKGRRPLIRGSEALNAEWRTLELVPLCDTHKQEAHQYFSAEHPNGQFRRIMTRPEIEALSESSGLRFEDLMQLHGERYFGETCVMCGQVKNNDFCCWNCNRLLPPEWPAVYCCNSCALGDA